MASVISVLAKLKADTGSYISGMKGATKATENFQKAAGQGIVNTEKTAKQSFDKMGQGALRMGTLVKGAIAGFITIQGAQFLKGAIASASTFQAEFEGVNQTFGTSAGIVQDYAKQAASSAGLSENSALRFAKSFGGYAKSAGLAGKAQADFATNMVQAAGDLGSFFDLPTESALMAIQQGLRGEYEPLRRFNILIDEATIGQKAMQMGLSTTGKNLTQQQKVMIRQKIIMEQMGVAQGDFVKYAGDYGNAIKTTGALFQNLSKDVGEALLPAMSKLAQAAVPLIEVLGPLLSTVVEALVPIVEAITTAMGGLEPVLKPIIDVLKIVAGVFAEFVKTILPPLLAVLTPILEIFAKFAEPIGALVTALLPPLADIIQTLASAFELLMPSIDAIIEAFTEMMPALVDLMAALAPILVVLVKLFFRLVEAFMPLIPMIYNLISKLLPPFVKLFESLLPVIELIANLMISVLVPALQMIFAVLGPVLGFIADVVAKAIESIAGLIDWLMPYISPVLNAIIDAINWTLSALGQPTIPRLNPAVKKQAYDDGLAIGRAQMLGLKDGGALIGAAPAGATAGTTPPVPKQEGGGQKKNSVVEFYKKMSNDIKQQKAKTKLLSMGLNEQLASSIISSGEGWEKIYSKIAKGGTKAIDNLKSKWAQTAEGLAAIGKTVEDSMSKIQDSIMNGFNLSNMGKSSKAILGNARKMVEKAKKFGAEIVRLSASGLNPTLLNQVIAAGPEEGMGIAKALQGTDITELNSLYNQLGETAMATGGAVAQNQVQYNITVNGGLGDKNSIGKGIVEAIKAFERSNSASWRTA